MRTRFLVPVIWGWAMLVLSCNGDGSHRLARFQQAVAAAPCPLWPEDFLRPQGLPSCPFPAGPGSELPCAVAMHLGTDSEPRLVRHFEFDQSGQLQAYSDHLLGRVADVRVFNYDKTGDHLEIQQAVQLCEHVAPRPLHTTHLHYSANGLLQGLSTQWVRSASITYEFTPHWYGDEARVLIGQHAIELSRQGYGATFYDHNTLTATVETHSRGAQLHRVLWRDPNGALQAHAIYDYNAAGRLKSLKVRYPQGPDHTYHFKYECTAVRARCVPFNQRPQDTPVYGGLLAHDPQLTHFEARSCSDQQSYGGRLCGRIWLPENALTARCCNTDPALFHWALLLSLTACAC